ncbi:MAG: STAS-like domain-containing protein [Vallitalea sp.]|jgi:hypothetical protein|nr:STAS-like domain-containing protein [Vallitalea sp.]
MEGLKLKISEQFTETPGPRFRDEGSFSGEEFRETILEKKYLECKKYNKKLIIDLDGTFGYGTSFLEEAFGGLARKYDKEEILEYIEFISLEEPYLIDNIIDYINEAERM